VTALPIGLTGVLFVVVLPVLAIVAQLLIRRSRPARADGEHNDVAGFILAVVGVIYAVPANTPVQQAYLGAEADRFNQDDALVHAERGRPSDVLHRDVGGDAPTDPGRDDLRRVRARQVGQLVVVEDARDGDLRAFEQLVRRYQRRIYRLALRMTASSADAEDVTQEVFLTAWRRLPELREDAAVVGAGRRL